MTVDYKEGWSMICDLKPGKELIDFFILRKKEIRTRRETNELFLSFELGDASGRINGSLWEDVQANFEKLDFGDIVKAKAKVVTFKNRPYLDILKIRKAEESDGYDLKQLVPSVDKDTNVLIAQLEEFIESVSEPHLKSLLHSVFDDSEIRKKFFDAPAGKLWHHNYLGGLLEHTLSVTDIAEKIGRMYPGVNRDLLVAAGLLHDIGKIESYTYKTLIDYTDEGRLIGHIVIGAQLVNDKIGALPDFPKNLQKELTHLILSHQGKLEQASPVVPMTLEGIILYYADEIDSKANAFLRIRKKEKKPGKKWSSYINLLNQYYYLGDDE